MSGHSNDIRLYERAKWILLPASQHFKSLCLVSCITEKNHSQNEKLTSSRMFCCNHHGYLRNILLRALRFSTRLHGCEFQKNWFITKREIYLGESIKCNRLHVTGAWDPQFLSEIIQISITDHPRGTSKLRKLMSQDLRQIVPRHHLWVDAGCAVL